MKYSPCPNSQSDRTRGGDLDTGGVTVVSSCELDTAGVGLVTGGDLPGGRKETNV